MSNSLDSLLDQIAEALAPRIAARLQANQPDSPNHLYSVAEAAKLLRVSPDMIYELVKGGVLKRASGFKVIRIRKSVLDAYAAQ